MSQQLVDCPKPKTLADFLLGNLSSHELETCQQHLASCAPCVDTIRGLKADDTLSGLARDAMLAKTENESETAESESQIVDQLILKMQGLSQLSHSHPSSEPERSTAGRAAEVQRLLSPPINADDVGCLGAYRLIRLLGAGSTGVVYQAVDQRLQRMVALKILRPSLGEAARERFVAEARATAAIEHSNVVTIYEVGPEGPLSYIAMQWLPGQTLEEKLSTNEVLSIDEVRQLAGQIADGLAAAHQQGLIHRDIKPANIWIPSDNSGAKILDFGLVRIADEDPQLTCTGMIAGTPCYMSPEQSRGQTLDQRSDLFSLGCLMYQSLVGRLPFRSDNALATLQSIQRDQPTPLVEVDPAIPTDISDLVMCLLAKTPNRRPPSASAVVEALKNDRTNWSFDPELAVQAAMSGINPSSSGSNRAPNRWKALAAAMAFLALGTIGFAGAMWGDQITRIVTNQGEIEIVTTIDDVKIDVVETKSGKVVTVDSGAGKVEVKAGEYTIRPSSGKDQDAVLIQNNQLTLTRGSKAVVIITRKDIPSLTASKDTPYLLDSGDTLGIFVDGVIGQFNSDPPVQTPPAGSGLPPAIGFPIQVESNGEISLPLIEPVKARGKTLAQVKQAIVDAYTAGDDPILIREESRIFITMMQQRNYMPPASVASAGTSSEQATTVRPPVGTIKIGEGDTLGIFVEGVLGQFGSDPPVHYPPAGTGLPPVIGFPIQIESGGNLSLPLIDKINVSGMTVSEIKQTLEVEFKQGAEPILKEDASIFVSLIHKWNSTTSDPAIRNAESKPKKEVSDTVTTAVVQLRMEQAELLQRLAPSHPRVQAIESRIKYWNEYLASIGAAQKGAASKEEVAKETIHLFPKLQEFRSAFKHAREFGLGRSPNAVAVAEEILLPDAVIAKPPSEHPGQIILNLEPNGGVTFEGRKYMIDKLSPIFLVEIASASREGVTNPADIAVIIRAHQDTPTRMLEELVSKCQNDKLSNISIRVKEKIRQFPSRSVVARVGEQIKLYDRQINQAIEENLKGRWVGRVSFDENKAKAIIERLPADQQLEFEKRVEQMSGLIWTHHFHPGDKLQTTIINPEQESENTNLTGTWHVQSCEGNQVTLLMRIQEPKSDNAFGDGTSEELVQETLHFEKDVKTYTVSLEKVLPECDAKIVFEKKQSIE